VHGSTLKQNQKGFVPRVEDMANTIELLLTLDE